MMGIGLMDKLRIRHTRGARHPSFLGSCVIFDMIRGSRHVEMWTALWCFCGYNIMRYL